MCFATILDSPTIQLVHYIPQQFFFAMLYDLNIALQVL